MKFDTVERRQKKQKLYENVAQMALLMATPVRLWILSYLAQGERSVDDIARTLNESMANTSQHLRKMAQGGLLSSRKAGLQRFYFLSSPSVYKLVSALQGVAEELSSEVQKLRNQLVPHELRSTESLERVLQKVKNCEVELLDVRSDQERRATPVSLAKHAPVKDESELKGVLDILNPDIKNVYVFCRGRYCVAAAKTTKYLREHGKQAWCLDETALEINDSDV